MKLYRDYKKQFNFLIVGGFLSLLVFIPYLPEVSFTVSRVYADTASELKQKINQKNADINKLEEEIKSYLSQIESLGKKKDSLSTSIKQLDLTRKKLQTDIAVTQNKIDKTNLKIQELSLDINDKEGSISNNVSVLARDIRQMNEFEQNDLLTTLLSEEDFTVVWNDIDNITSLNQKIIETTSQLRQIKSGLEDTRQETTDAKNELISLKAELADQKKIADQNRAEKNKLLSQTKNNEAAYQTLLKDRLAKKEAFEKELSDYESQLKYVLNPSSLPSGGVLSWPLDYVYITQLFGKTEAGKRLYANGTHNGVDFRASVGTPVRSMSNGIVAGTGNTDLQCNGVSFGKFILIKYDNGLASTYGHLSLVKVATGQRVSRGQVVGYSGNTGYSTGPHLHVSVYARDAVKVSTIPSKSCPGTNLTLPVSPINAYLDPMYYLPVYKK